MVSFLTNGQQIAVFLSVESFRSVKSVNQFKRKYVNIVCLMTLGDKERLRMETSHRKECQGLFLQ